MLVPTLWDEMRAGMDGSDDVMGARRTRGCMIDTGRRGRECRHVETWAHDGRQATKVRACFVSLGVF